MATHTRHTLGDLIDALRALPSDAEVNGLTPLIHSYRGYYERNAVAPNWDNVINAHDLASTYEAQIGGPITGWKGGDYEIRPTELIYLTQEGDTGPAIIGLLRDPVSDIYEPILLADDFYF